MAEARFIVNPVAGGGQSARRWERLQPLLRELGLDHRWELTVRPGDATRLAAAAVEAGCRQVVAVGGDGTVNEVANGLLLATRGAAADVGLGIIPTGRGVDLCRTVGIPLDCEQAARRLLAARAVALDVGEVEYVAHGGGGRRYFLNFAGLGFDVEVVRRASRLSAGGGTVPYLTSVFLSLFSYRNRRLEMVLDGEVVRQKISTVVVANGQYFGGGMRIAPQASPVDGLLDVVVIGDVGKLELAVNLPKIYEGSHLSHPKVQTRRVQQAEMHSVEPVYVQADGDPLGETPVRVHLLQGALRLLV